MPQSQAEQVIVHHAEVELIANKVAHETAVNMLARIPEVMAPKIYEIAEKVSNRNVENFRNTMRIVLGVDPENEESIRNYQSDMNWLRERRINEVTDRRVARSAGIRSFITHICSAFMGSGFMLWFVQHFNSIPKIPTPGGP